MRLNYRDRRAQLWYFNRIKTTINRIKTTIDRINQQEQAVGIFKSVDVRSRDNARVPKNAEETPGTSEAAKRTNAPAQTVTWTRLLNFTAGRRTHTMACAHSELGTGHCGRRIGTKIFQDDSCSSSTRPAERQVRGVVLSKEQGSLPPSAGNTAAPSRFGGLLARVFYDRFTADWGFQRMFSH